MGKLIDGEFRSRIRAIGGPGIDYTSLSAWEVDRRGDVTARNWIEVAEVIGHPSGGATSDVGTVILLDANWTTDSSDYIIIRAHPSYIAGTKFDSTNAFIDGRTPNAIGVRNDGVDFTRIEGLTILAHSTKEAISMEDTNGPRVQKNWCWGGLGIFIEGVDSGAANQCITHSNIVLEGGNGTSRAGLTTATTGNTGVIHRVYNNTVVSGVDGIRKFDSNNTQSRNNYFHQTEGDVQTYVGEAFAGNQHDITANGDSLINDDFRFKHFEPSSGNYFVDPHNQDFGLTGWPGHPFLGSGQNMNVPPSTALVTDDIDNQERGEGTVFQDEDGIFDIGADQFYNVTPTVSVGGYVLAEPGTVVSGFIIGAYVEGTPLAKNSIFRPIGAYVLAQGRPGDVAGDFLGGYMNAEAGGSTPTVSVGGWVNTIQKTASGPFFIGGIASGLNQTEDFLGGYIFGEPINEEFVETHARTLAKASDSLAIDQLLEIDGVLIFKETGDKDFNARIGISRTTDYSFNAKLAVDKFKVPPFVTILNVETSGNGLCKDSGLVTVTASGTLGDGDQWIQSYIDFGEPVQPNDVRSFNSSISGFTGNPPWTASHCYASSGIYSIVARGQDNLGMVGSDVELINLASGLVPGIDFPAFAISGLPRLGFVPPSLRVDFTLSESGVLNLISPTADEDLYWNFGNRETSQRTNPFSNYHSPGLYAVVARFKYRRPDGNIVWMTDTLRVGFNF